MERCDVLIIGGGPAGASAAMTLARQGRHALLLDKAAFPRPKLCGGLLTRKSMLLLQRVFGLTPEQGLAEGVLDFQASGYQVFQRRRMLFQSPDGYPFHFVKRDVLDTHLLRQAQAAGVDVRENSEVCDVIPQQGRVTTRHGQVLQAQVIIAADGANSIARRRSGFDPKAWKHNLAAAMEIHIPRKQLDDPPDKPRVYTGFAGGGYCWSFPNSDRVALGVCELVRSPTTLKHRFNDFVQELGLEQGGLPKPGAHPLPYGNYLKQPAHERVLLAGDAAGMVEPLFGEGMFFAMRSGELAAATVGEALEKRQSLDPEAVARAYVRRIRKEVLPEFRWSKILRNLLYYSKEYNAMLPIKSMSWDGGRRILDIIHGERSFRLFGLRH